METPLSKYFPCQVTCAEPFLEDPGMTRYSCRHGIFVVMSSGGRKTVEDMCRTARAMELLDDYAAGRVKVDDANRKILRQHRLIP